MRAQKIRNVVGTIVGFIIAFFILCPFFLVVINSAKTSADIVVSPIALPKNWAQMLTNFKGVKQYKLQLLEFFQKFYDNHSCFFGTSDIIFIYGCMGTEPSSQRRLVKLYLYDVCSRNGYSFPGCYASYTYSFQKYRKLHRYSDALKL